MNLEESEVEDGAFQYLLCLIVIILIFYLFYFLKLKKTLSFFYKLYKKGFFNNL